MSFPLITVVLPVYNVEPYIEESLKSILNQTIQDFEIIVIDDCSTDNTIRIIKSFKDLRIKIIFKDKNKGLVDSLNIGFSLAKGKYIARVDGDDLCALDRFEKQLNLLNNHNDIAICGSWVQTFGNIKQLNKHPEYHEEIKADLLNGLSISLGSSMFVREKIKHFYFNSEMEYVEDYDFVARNICNYKMYNIQEVLYFYRIHNTQICRIFNNEQRGKDKIIQLQLLKKLKYNTSKFTDDIVFCYINNSNNIKTFFQIKLFNEWCVELIQNNINIEEYDNQRLIVNINKIKTNLYNSIFFDERKSFVFKIKILVVLSLKEIVFYCKEFFKIKKYNFKKRVKLFIKQTLLPNR